MNGEQYRTIIARLGFTQVGAAEFLGVRDTTSRRWIADVHPIPRATAMLLRAAVKYKLPVDALKRLGK